MNSHFYKKYYSIKMNIIRYYLLLNSKALKFYKMNK